MLSHPKLFKPIKTLFSIWIPKNFQVTALNLLIVQESAVASNLFIATMFSCSSSSYDGCSSSHRSNLQHCLQQTSTSLSEKILGQKRWKV